jgi:hypothetical protein
MRFNSLVVERCKSILCRCDLRDKHEKKTLRKGYARIKKRA